MKVEIKGDWMVITHRSESMDLCLRVPAPEGIVYEKAPRMEDGGRKELDIGARQVIDKFNEIFGDVKRRGIKPVEAHLRFIRQRIREGATLQDFAEVFKRKKDSWVGTKFEKYLRIETLCGSKFWSYLNETEPERKPGFISGDSEQYFKEIF